MQNTTLNLGLRAALGLFALSGIELRAESLDNASAPGAQGRPTLSENESVQTIEEITVSARGTADDLPSALATDVVSWEDSVAAPVDFQDLITRVPGVGATGQNGLFETFSIRGSGANGILILVGGMPVTAQRRAGVPVAFVEPALLGQINITRGPAAVHFGPGALGGAISIEPRWFEAPMVSASYVDSGNESSLVAGYGNETVSIGAARHRAGDSESANGTPLNTSYDRVSASLQWRAEVGDYSLDALFMPSKTDDIGKSNSRFPTRDTTYPEDDHWIGRLRLRHANGFSATVHGHDQSLLTYNQRPGSADTFAFIESFDLGGTVQQSLESGNFTHNIGLEYLGRREVNGFDARGNLSNRTYSLRNGEENNWSLFAISDWQVTEQFALEFGARYSEQDQTQGGAKADDSDHALSLGAVWRPTSNQRWSLNLASGFRFATLEERYFTGVTAAGEIVGNPDLGSESSRGIDLGYAWHSGAWEGQVHIWRTDVDDLIQLFQIGGDVNGYTNVGKARLHGGEASLGWAATPNLWLRGGFTLVRSKDELTGDPLYGSPPPTASLEAKYDWDQFTLGALYTHRFEMDRPGFEELRRDSVNLLDLDLSYEINQDWRAQLFVRNALDEDYYATADDLSTFGQERSVGVNLSWSLH
ncbi:MAG: TonB-dependent receptor [Xanthomonadales bacterium]|nr:TonB-dependent receptor [Xanthomonadales bacterium]